MQNQKAAIETFCKPHRKLLLHSCYVAKDNIPKQTIKNKISGITGNNMIIPEYRHNFIDLNKNVSKQCSSDAAMIQTMAKHQCHCQQCHRQIHNVDGQARCTKELFHTQYVCRLKYIINISFLDINYRIETIHYEFTNLYI